MATSRGSQFIVLKSLHHIPVGPKPFRHGILLFERKCSKHPSGGWAVFEAAAGKPATDHQIVSKTVDYGIAVRGHGIHAGFQNRRLPVIKQWKVIPNVALDLFDIRLERGQVAGVRVSLWPTVKQHLDKAMIFAGR